MSISLFNLFSVGIGPSSSHTVGPMRAAHEFLTLLPELSTIGSVTIDLYGSLALTGKGHGTFDAVLLGLEGHTPAIVDPDSVPRRAEEIRKEGRLNLANKHSVPFELLIHTQELLPLHSNGMRFTAYNHEKKVLISQVYYSIGGGFIVTAEQFGQEPSNTTIPYPFHTAHELFALCRKHNLKISELIFANEQAWRPPAEIREGLLNIANTMRDCVERGCNTEGILPGGLNVKRRAPGLYKQLMQKESPARSAEPNLSLWPTVYAMAVNEENAAGGRIVTAPTNGASGTIPAVLNCYRNFYAGANDDGIVDFLLTACAIGILYKLNASISGAEVGCQGEVGVACSMAAGALAAVLGGTIEQIENAAEMAMEHHLGLTCDPIAGLVQIPCIERNGVAAEKAIRLAHLALMESGADKKVPLDKVIATMFQTGKDMMTIYKETSLGGLAVNRIEC